MKYKTVSCLLQVSKKHTCLGVLLYRNSCHFTSSSFSVEFLSCSGILLTNGLDSVGRKKKA